MVEKVLAIMLVALVAGARLAGPASAQSGATPEEVVEAVFEAARSSNPAKLGGLCDPRKENDGDTRDICSLTRESAKWTRFVTWFSKGKVAGGTTIDGDRAAVPIVFGPDGTKRETFNLVRSDGRWYLMSF